MDRFIVILSDTISTFSTYLKSNMDRFIVGAYHCWQLLIVDLKSNMDRFIAVKRSNIQISMFI